MRQTRKDTAWSQATLVLSISSCILLLAIPRFASGQAPERNAYFGDLHVHTSYSLDAYIFGTTNDPRTAYRFARGEQVEIAGGIAHRLRVPLDFAAVTDHAETFADVQFAYLDPNSPAYESEYAKRIRSGDVQAFVESMTTDNVKKQFFGGNQELERQAARGIWERIQKIADEFYEPGKFTTFKAWEWSWARADQMMMHRNVIFRGDAVTPDAKSSFDLPSPELLWEYLDKSCTGDCRVISIPHNTNWSWGYGFSLEKPRGDGQYSEQDLERRARLERLVEIQQVKGNSEAFIGLGATDEEADFEQLFSEIGDLGEQGKMAYGSTVRNGLKLGLQIERELGFNPFQVGIIASTDNHNGVAGDTQEDTYNGHEGTLENMPEQRRGGSHSMIAGGILNNPGGLAGVWAEENTRESVFDALARRETFGTSGTRIRVRFFGGFGYEAGAVDDLVNIGYAAGVPMGGELRRPAKPAPMRFLLWALKDPNGANLDKIQIVKGWLDADGEMHEKVYDVVAAANRKRDKDGRFVPVGNTVNSREASYSNTVGDVELIGSWQDPEFDASQSAFYYARVLEIPTPRYSTYDAKRLGVDPAASGVPVTIQERAWTSPIWYKP